MQVTIAHLYYDLLNLYGESGNVKALKRQLEDQGIEVSIKFLTIGDTLEFDKYDFIYMGMGTEENQKLCLKHLMTYKEEVRSAILSNKFFFVTGNSIEMFGKYIIDRNLKKHRALNVFPYSSKEEEFRMVDETVVKSPWFDEPIVGFQNQGSVIKDNKSYMFDVIKGIGSYPKSPGEGYHSHQFYGTYLIGPILVRNPILLKYIVRHFISNINPTFKFKRFHLSLELNAYHTYMKQYEKTQKQ